MDKSFDAAAAERAVSEAWAAARAFRAGANARPGAEPYCIMIPPPNVTGSLHMGHAFNNTLQDILVRWHRMRGFDTLWQAGTDHAGIATQMVVERELAREGNAGRREMGREAFVARVWEQKRKSEGTILGQLKRLGASCDWDRVAFTMDPNFHDAVLRVFVELYDKGLIFRGKRLVNWDPHFETAISDLEVEQVEVQGHMWHFRYPLAGGATYEHVERDAEGNETLRETRDYISIATTRPETMLGDGAVAVHPSDARYAPIVGMLCEIPVGPKEHRRLIPIITDDYPDPAFGSGAVKITGAHDFNDHAVAERNGLPLYVLMDAKARMRADGLPYAESARIAGEIARGEREAGGVGAVNLVPEELRGLDRMEARKRVVVAIEAEGLMLRAEPKTIMQPFGDRSKVVIEPYLTDQWYVDAKALAAPAIAAVREGRTAILPPAQEKTFFHWLENIEPWCISRQLWWGHQVPVWYGPVVPEVRPDGPGRLTPDGTAYAFCAPDHAAARRLAEAHYTVPVHGVETQSADWADGADGGALVEVGIGRDPDVLDTWFSSALWPFGTLGWPEETPELARYYPGSVLVTGFDILFFWVARMMMMGLHFRDEVPFRTVYLHALVRDEKGKKMSKSLGNVLDPLDLIDRYGADAVRFTLASMAAMGRDLRLSEARIAGYRNFVTKLWNAARFAEMNGATRGGFDPASTGERLNRWIVGETARVREATDAALGAFRFNDAANALYAFVWGTVCDWYLEFAKPLLAEGHPARGETQATLGWVMDQCLILLHPIMPFVTETLWRETAERPKLLVHADWPAYGAELVDPAAEAEMRWVIGLIEEVRSVRAEMNVAPGAQVPLLVLEADAEAEGRLARAAALIGRLARVPDIPRAGAAPKGAVTLTLPGAVLCLPLGGVIDVAAEKARLGKALDKLGKEIAGLSGKLSNAAFVAKAPEEVVEEQRERLAEAEGEAAKLRSALARLGEIA